MDERIRPRTKPKRDRLVRLDPHLARSVSTVCCGGTIKSKLMEGRASLTFGLLMVYVSFFLLKEIKPAGTSTSMSPHVRGNAEFGLVLYLVAGILFAGGQVIFFLASEPLCNVRSIALATLIPHDAGD